MALPRRHIALKTHQEVIITDFDANYARIEGLCSNETQLRSFIYSPDGSMIAYVLPSCIRISSVLTSEVIIELPSSNVIEVEFSPKGTYISTWERMIRAEDNDSMHKNLIIWESASGKPIASFTQKLQTGWNIQWTEAETYFARLVTNEIQLFSPSCPSDITERIRLEGVNAFSISPGKRSILASFIPEKKGAPATVQLFELGLGLGSNQQALATKSFFRADTCTFYWNKLGTNVIVFTHTDVDTTGQSYYGETQLYYLSIAGQYEARVELGKAGPIHDVAWSPNSKEFIVVYGTMPARTTLFDHRANPVYHFGSGPRNFVKYSPAGRIICIAGFGNLSGEMEFWDRKTCVKISTVQASNSSACEWAPDGRHVMTSTLYRRLKVDNGIKIWHYTGVLIHKFDVKELHQAAWRPLPDGLWDEGGALEPAPAEVDITPVKKVGAYRPPGARADHGANSSFSRRLNHERELASSPSNSNVHRSSTPSGSVIGAAPNNDRIPSKSAMKNKKRQSKKQREDDDQQSFANGSFKTMNNGASHGGPATTAKATSILSVDAPPFAPASEKCEIEKKIKNITKKLQGIQEIKDRISKGEKVEKNQLSKLDSELALQVELKDLSAQRG